MRFLVESGARVNAMTSSNETPVFIAAKNGFSTVVSVTVIFACSVCSLMDHTACLVSFGAF